MSFERDYQTYVAYTQSDNPADVASPWKDSSWDTFFNSLTRQPPYFYDDESLINYLTNKLHDIFAEICVHQKNLLTLAPVLREPLLNYFDSLKDELALGRSSTRMRHVMNAALTLQILNRVAKLNPNGTLADSTSFNYWLNEFREKSYHSGFKPKTKAIAGSLSVTILTAVSMTLLIACPPLAATVAGLAGLAIAFALVVTFYKSFLDCLVVAKAQREGQSLAKAIQQFGLHKSAEKTAESPVVAKDSLIEMAKPASK